MQQRGNRIWEGGGGNSKVTFCTAADFFYTTVFKDRTHCFAESWERMFAYSIDTQCFLTLPRSSHTPRVISGSRTEFLQPGSAEILPEKQKEKCLREQQ